MLKKAHKSKQVRIMDMTKEQLLSLIDRREKQLVFAKVLLQTKFYKEA